MKCYHFRQTPANTGILRQTPAHSAILCSTHCSGKHHQQSPAISGKLWQSPAANWQTAANTDKHQRMLANIANTAFPGGQIPLDPPFTTSLLPSTSLFAGICWCLPCLPVFSGLYRCLPVSAGVCGCFTEFAGVCRCLPVLPGSAGNCRCLPVIAGVCWCLPVVLA